MYNPVGIEASVKDHINEAHQTAESWRLAQEYKGIQVDQSAAASKQFRFLLSCSLLALTHGFQHTGHLLTVMHRLISGWLHMALG